MSLIEQLGGYEKAKEYLIELQKTPIHEQTEDTVTWLPDMLLEYRRFNNIFEVEDKVVSINSAFIEYRGVLNIDFINRFDLMLSDDCKGFEVNAICGWSKIIRHATDEEIAAGHRL